MPRVEIPGRPGRFINLPEPAENIQNGDVLNVEAPPPAQEQIREYQFNYEEARQRLREEAGNLGGQRVRVGRPWNPHPPVKNVVPLSAEKVQFDQTPLSKIFPTSTSLLPVETIQKFQRHHPDWFGGKYKFRDGGVHVGIEVEAENILRIDPQLPLCFWSIHEDGSLRNNGREFKTYPMPLQYTEAALRQLFDSLNDDLDFSKRTSIHVHLDVRQMSLSEIMGIVYTYAAVENLLFKYAGADRRNSIFCVPLIETELLNYHFSDPVRSLYTNCNSWPKYSALNVKPIASFGTLEFRQLPGTNNIQKIVTWMDMLASLRIFAYRYRLQDIVNQIGMLNTSSAYKHFVEDIFGPLTVFLDTSNLLGDMEKACCLVKNASTTNEFHQKVLQGEDSKSSLFLRLNQSTNHKFSSKEVTAILRIGHHYWPYGQDVQRHWNMIVKSWDQLRTIGDWEPQLAILRSRYKSESQKEVVEEEGEEPFAE